MTTLEKLVSLVALGVVGFGAFRIRTVLAAEEFHRPEALHRVYADVNRQGFAGALPDVRTDWAVLKSPEASGETFFDGKGFVILLDPDNNPTPEEARLTMMHEACHVATYGKDSDPHGPTFQACRARLQKFGAVGGDQKSTKTSGANIGWSTTPNVPLWQTREFGKWNSKK